MLIRCGRLNWLIVIVLVSLLAAAGSVATGCRFSEKTMPTITIDKKPDRSYLTINELTQDAAAIVRVKVLSSETTDKRAVDRDDSAIISLARVQVIRSYKGSVSADDEISVLETGGVVEQDGRSVDIQVNGISIMNPEEAYILFLSLISGSDKQAVYAPLGIYQGKFSIEKNIVRQLAPDAEKLTDQAPLSVDVFSAEIMAAVIGQRITYQ